MDAIFYIGLAIIFLYALTIILITLGWRKVTVFKRDIIKTYPEITVLIACRNEEHIIGNLLNSLSKQNYPKEKTEIIIVNDHSEDNTESVVKKSLNDQIRFFNLPDNLTGKKKALQYGINHAKSDLVLTTDADCTIDEYWITSMVSYYLQHKPKLLVGPVILKPQITFFQKLQALEFLSLIGSGAGAIGLKRPIMCNGANLFFEKSIFTSNLAGDDFASGDDIFLLLSTKKENKEKIHFIKSTDAIVYTKPIIGITEFFNQRIRWTSKSKGYRDVDLIYTALIVAITNLLIISVLVAAAFNSWYLIDYVLFITIKSIVDIVLLRFVNRFFKNEKLIWWFIPLQLIYSFYIVIIVIFGLFGRFEWKKRFFR